MIMQESDTADALAHEDAQRAQAYLELVHAGLAQKRATPVTKRKESEAQYRDALDAATDEEEYELLVLASLTDPGNAEALLTLKDYFDLTLEEDLMATRGIVMIAEKRLGKKAFKDYAAHFWGFLETRPYMRARAELGGVLSEAGMTDLAIAEWEALIGLNPNDNQGLRFVLLPLYLQLGQPEQAAGLIARFPDDATGSALFAWCLILERLLQKDEPGAAAALAAARSTNGYSEAFLLGHRQPPNDLPETYEPGTREEAAFFSDILSQAWDPHPDALKWLFAQPKAKR